MLVTLKTLAQATPQQVFDQVVDHLRTQKVKSKDPVNNRCLYRYADLKCAAGCLIADDEYVTQMDNDTGSSWRCLVQMELVPNAHEQLIRELQTIHDGAENNWEAQLEGLAHRSSLQFTPITQ